MKATKLTYLLVIAVALTFAATGCRKRPVGVTDIPGRGTRVGEQGLKPIDTGTKLTPDTGPFGVPGSTDGVAQSDRFSNLDNFNQDRAALAAHTVHFDFDSSVVKSSDRSNVEAAAAYLKATPNVGLLIEGHCDERGTEEYNRSLGERRALAIRDMVIGSGVEADRVVTVSFGEDKPEAPEHDEAAYSINRRGVFVVLHPK